MNIEEIKEFLKANGSDEKVKAFLSEFAPNAEKVKAFLDTDEGKRLIQPMLDKRVTDAIKTYKEGHFDDEVKASVAAEILKRNPKETEEQKRLREVEQKLEQAEAKAKRAELHKQGMELLTKEGIPSWWIEQFTGGTIEEFTVFADRVKESYAEREAKVKNELLAGSFKPGAGNNAAGTKSMVDISKMDSKQKFEYFKAEAEKREAAIATQAAAIKQ
jgi:hypothetical protein